MQHPEHGIVLLGSASWERPSRELLDSAFERVFSIWLIVVLSIDVIKALQFKTGYKLFEHDIIYNAHHINIYI